VLRFLDPDVALPLRLQPTPPDAGVAGRSRDELVRLLAFGLEGAPRDHRTLRGAG
jgi:hypothetical protein